jgi:predicted ATPase/class 3 adenylate cyclase
MLQTRAILVTDVVESTRLAERVGDARIAEVWVAHDRLVRDLLPRFAGTEVDRTDGFLLIFDHVDDALGFARAFHPSLRALSARYDVPFRARVGVHWGSFILIQTPEADRARGAKPVEMEGVAKATAARVMSLASGGQTLLSGEARERCVDVSHRVVSHGWWRMKGVLEPAEIFEAGEEDTAFEPPADQSKVYRVVRDAYGWRPVSELTCRIPSERDLFVGRAADLQRLARIMGDDARLVTVLGLGGVGKTRLCLRFARTWLGDYPGGTYFCDLSDARDAEDILRAVGVALDVPLGGENPEEQLCAAIVGRGRCLLVLDTFEPVVRHARATVGRWLDRAPEVRLVVSSRERLGLVGERILELAPLDADDSVALFRERAAAACPELQFSEADAAAIAALVGLLDGLPLAVELAAARVRLMPPTKLLERMTERFRLLASTGGRHARQATLRATLDWSWELLGGDEKAALGQLAVFDGPFSVEAAESVVSLTELWPADAVQALVDKSLVRRVGEGRFALLSSVQAYATEKLDSGGGRTEAERRHGVYFARFGTEAAIDALDVRGGVARRTRLAEELGNIEAACRRAVARGEAGVALDTLRAAGAVLALQGPFGRWVDLAESVAGLEHPPSSASVVARLLGDALDAVGQGERADASYREALSRSRAAGSRAGEARTLFAIGNRARSAGRMEASEEAYAQTLAILREAPDRVQEGLTRGSLGELLRMQGRSAEAMQLCEEALAIHREVGNRRAEAAVIMFIANADLVEGRMEAAAARCEEALHIADELGSRRYRAMVRFNLSVLHAEAGALERGRSLAEQALREHREIGNRRSEGLALGQLGWFDALRGAHAQAATHYDGALAIHRELGNRRGECSILASLGALEHGRGRPAEARAHYARALALARAVNHVRLEGAVQALLAVVLAEAGEAQEARAALDAGEVLLRSVSDRVELAKLFCRRAEAEAALADGRAAGQALGEARALTEALGLPAESEVGRTLRHAEEAVAARVAGRVEGR